jgi:hypothetical protein
MLYTYCVAIALLKGLCCVDRFSLYARKKADILRVQMVSGIYKVPQVAAPSMSLCVLRHSHVNMDTKNRPIVIESATGHTRSLAA